MDKHGLYMVGGAVFLFPAFSGDLSMGRDVETTVYFSRAVSGVSQSLYRRKRTRAASVSINLNFTRLFSIDLAGVVQDGESLCGVTGELFWRGEDLGLFCVESVGITPQCDGAGFSAVGLALSMRSAYTSEPFRTVTISTLNRGTL